MSKEIDLIKCIISEIDDNLYSDFGGNPCISYTSNLKKLLLALDTPEVRYFFENYEQQDQRIVELEEQLKNAIVPKFKVGQKVWFMDNEKDIQECEIYELKLNRYVRKLVYNISYNIGLEDWADDVAFEDELFATKEEAQAKLEELGGNK